jgi:hypothetical protein
MKVYIDGIEVINPQPTTLNPKITIRRKNEAGEEAVSFTGDLSFFGVDYDYIYNKLVLAPNAINDSIVLLLVDECCENKEYPFLIKPESLRWCENSCEISANAIEYTPNSLAYACVENTLIWDNWAGFQSFVHPKIKYCLEYRPSILQDFALIIGCMTLSMIGVFIPVLATIALVVGTINAVIGVVNSLGGSLNTIGGFNGSVSGQGTFMDWAFNQYNSFGKIVAGCGFEHPSPLVRDYITNVCGKCGIGFSSSILDETDPTKPNNDYYNLVYFNAPIKHGRINIAYFAKPQVPYIDENKPIHNGKTFLDELVQPFNAGWDISNGVLRFERVDFFQSLTPWFDVTAYEKEKVISECYEWASKRRPAYAEIGYERDPIDWVGTEATRRFSEIIEWNSPVNPIQKGAFVKQFPYSTPRFRRDGIERDVLEDYKWLPFGIGTSIINNDESMIMNSGTSWLPKLLIWNNQNGPNDITDAVVKWQYPVTTGATRSYNFPMWVGQSYPGALYQRFWQIEDPRNASFSGFDFEISIIWDCQTKNSIDINGNVMTTRGLSKTIDFVELDFEKNIMTIKGTI